jgi:hypothetical protein
VQCPKNAFSSAIPPASWAKTFFTLVNISGLSWIRHLSGRRSCSRNAEHCLLSVWRDYASIEVHFNGHLGNSDSEAVLLIRRTEGDCGPAVSGTGPQNLFLCISDTHKYTIPPHLVGVACSALWGLCPSCGGWNVFNILALLFGEGFKQKPSNDLPRLHVRIGLVFFFRRRAQAVFGQSSISLLKKLIVRTWVRPSA